VLLKENLKLEDLTISTQTT